VFVGLSVVGYFGLVWTALAAPVAHLSRRNVLFWMAFTGACVWAADLLALALKMAVARPRPFETIPEPIRSSARPSASPCRQATRRRASPAP
jgi:CDP-diglyceride synthetase